MKGKPIDVLVYEQLFKTPKQGDCQNFNALLQRQLVPEVRLETAAFYGNLDTKEAQYPGLDYSHPPHRMRLSRFPWHRRLFRAFDNLGLTKSEIASLTKWEGTRWAKERFEKEQGFTIEDTTGNEIGVWVEPRSRGGQFGRGEQEADVEGMEDVEEEEEEADEEDSDLDTESVGLELNERLRARLESNTLGTNIDEQWEQWMKEITERGDIDMAQNMLETYSGSPFLRTPTSSRPQQIRSEVHRDTWTEALTMSTRPADNAPLQTARLTRSASTSAPRANGFTPTSAPSQVDSTTPSQTASRQPDGHRRTTRTPIQSFAMTTPFLMSSVSNPASHRQQASTVPLVVPSRQLPWNRNQPRQAQPPRP